MEPVSSLRALFDAFSPPLRRRVLILLPAMFTGAMAELVALAAVLPLLALLAGIDRPSETALFGVFTDWIGGGSQQNLISRAVLIVLACVAASCAFRVAILWEIQRVIAAAGNEISCRIFNGVLRQSYADHLRRDTNETLASIEKVQVVLYSSLLPILQSVLAITISGFILVAMLSIEPMFGVAVSAIVIITYCIVNVFVRPRLHTNSSRISSLMTRRVRSVRDALGGIRDIKLTGSASSFERVYEQLDRQYRRAQGGNLFISSAPRFLLEVVAAVALGALVLQIASRSPAGGEALPTLGLLILGSQRLLPLLQTAYFGISTATGAARTVRDVVALLQKPDPEPMRKLDGQPLQWKRDLRLRNVSFKYENAARPVLSDITARIRCGGRVGIKGPSGSGKTTLLDLIMGLLSPSQGTMMIDGKALSENELSAWQRGIAHVPQSIYLADDTVAANIAFGLERSEIDLDRVEEAARLAHATPFVRDLPLGYQTLIGSRGIRLSGGQAQRLAIARALYRKPRVLILDESTNQLDPATELAVIGSLANLPKDVTLIVVAHRDAVLNFCDVVLQLDGGRIARRQALRASGS